MLEESQSGPLSEQNKLVGIFVLIFIIIILFFISLTFDADTTSMKKFEYRPEFYNQPIFESYDFKTNGKDKYNWSTTDSGLLEICLFWEHSMGWFNDVPRPIGKDAQTVFENWICEVHKELSNTAFWNANTIIPWGSIKDVFTINLCNVLAYYILLKHSSYKIMALCSEIILKIIQKPDTSLGETLSGIELCYATFPWVVARQFEGIPYEEEPSYLDAIKEYNLFYKEKDMPFRQGFKKDTAYLQEDNFYNYGHMDAVYYHHHDMIQIDSNILSLIDTDVEYNHKILRHKNVPYNSLCLSGPHLNALKYDKDVDNNGFGKIVSLGVLRYHSDIINWNIKMCNLNTCYYFTNDYSSKTSYYATFFRGFFRQGFKYEPKFPNEGFIYSSTTDLIDTPANTKYYVTRGDAFFTSSFTRGVYEFEHFIIAWQYNVKYVEVFNSDLIEVILIDKKNLYGIVKFYATDGSTKYYVNSQEKYTSSKTGSYGIDFKTGVLEHFDSMSMVNGPDASGIVKINFNDVMDPNKTIFTNSTPVIKIFTGPEYDTISPISITMTEENGIDYQYNVVQINDFITNMGDELEGTHYHVNIDDTIITHTNKFKWNKNHDQYEPDNLTPTERTSYYTKMPQV